LRIVRARLARLRTPDGLGSASAGAKLGTIYEVDLDRVASLRVANAQTGDVGLLPVIQCQQLDGKWGWMALGLLDVEMPSGFILPEASDGKATKH
jgi:hypothetical protein